MSLDIPQLSIDYAEVFLIGDSSLIVHAWSEKAKKEMLAKQTKAARGGREAKDPMADFRSSLYQFPDGGYGFPSVAFKASAVQAITSVSGITKVAARQAFHVTGEMIEMKGAFPGILMQQDLARIIGPKPSMREDMVRVGMGTADLRYRGEFWPWAVRLSLRYNTRALSLAQILNVMNTAGFATGVGEWRSEKDGLHGAFHVAETQEEIEAYLSKHGVQEASEESVKLPKKR